jgi:transcriptional regulator with XRE-family HTH domain
MSELGTSLRKFRAEKGFSLERLAARVGVSAAYLSNVETGKTVPSTQLVRVLASVLRLEAAQLLGREVASSERLLPKASVVRRLKAELIRKAHADLIDRAMAWDEIGWMELEALAEALPGKLRGVAVEDLLRLGLLEKRERKVRIRLDAARDDALGKALLAFRNYKEDIVLDEAEHEKLEQCIAQASPTLGKWDKAQRRIAGVYLMLEETLVRILPEWLIVAKVPPPLFESQRPRWYASLAERIILGCESDSGEAGGEALQGAANLLRELDIVRDGGPSILPPQPAPAELSPIVDAAIAYFALEQVLHLEAALDVAACSWVLWTKAMTALGAPRAEETLVHRWRPAIFKASSKLCGSCFEDPAEWHALLANDPLSSTSLEPAELEKLMSEESPTEEALSRYRLTDVFCLPWDL